MCFLENEIFLFADGMFLFESDRLLFERDKLLFGDDMSLFRNGTVLLCHVPFLYADDVCSGRK